MKRITSFILLCAAMLVANAQSRHVYGRVVDSDNDEPLIGVSVMPVGGGAGTVTDLDGNFYLGLDNTVSQIKVSYVGMQTETLEAHFGEEMLIKMKSLDYALDEVIVVAYGTSTKGAYTGSASVVNAAQLEDRLVTDVTKALSGTVAGVQIQSASGQPGTEPVVRIRGVGSINAGMDPLYVVDGIPFDGGMNSINPQDVESITVLKDAASAALYGARGANGVILVTTKKGREGRKITLDARWGVNSRQVPRYDVITSPSDYMLAVYNSRRNYYIYRGQSEEAAYGFAVNGNSKDPGLNGKPGQNALGYQMWTIPDGQSLVLPDGTFNPEATLGYCDGTNYFIPDDWQKESYRNGFRQEYNLSVQGGSSAGTYMISGSYLEDEGSIVCSSFQRATVRATGDYDLYKWLKVGTNMQYTYECTNSPDGQTETGYSDNVTYMADYIAPVYPMYIRDAEGRVMRDAVSGQPLYDYGMKGLGLPYSRAFVAGGNPTGSLIYDKSAYMHDVFNGKWFVQVKPLDGLTLTGTMGYYLSHRQYDFFSNDKYGQSSTYHGSVRQSASRNSSVNLQGLANYKCSFADKHNMDFLLGYEQYSLNMSGIWGSGRNVYSGFNHTLSNIIDNKELGGEKDYYATRGIFGRVNYNYDNRYFGSVSYRRDASSRFARDHRWGNFWSLSAAWDISNEEFFEPLSPVVDFLKYKISFGQQGNDQMAQGGVINNYPYIDQYNQGGANGVWSVGTLFFKGNPNLTWETSNSFNTGFDFSLWHGMLSGSLEYFMRQTDDMLFFKPTGLSSGYSSIPMNIGSMRNIGIELDLNFRPVATDRFTWDLNLNLTYIDNKIIKLAPELNGRWQSGSQIFEEGKSRYQLYLVKYAGVDPDNGSSLWWGRHADGTEFKTADFNVAYNGDKSTGDVSNRQATGNMLPPVYGGFGTSLQAFGFDFSMQFAYQLGGRILDSGYQQLMNGAYQEDKGSALHKDLLNAWTPESSSGSVPRLDWGAKYTGATSDRWLTSSDYLSLNNISLGYTLPKSLTSKVGLESIRIYGAADNVALWSKRKGMDPRQSYIQSYAGYYAALRTISGGIKVTL